MKVVLISLFILLYSISSFGQKAKTEEIIKRVSQQEYVDAIYKYSDKNELDSMSIRFSCQNSKYEHLSDLITLYYGTPKGFYTYLTNLERYYDDNLANVSDKTSVSGNVNNQKVRMYKVSFVTGFDVYTEDGYHSFTIKWITKIKSKFVDWCKKNKVAYE